MGTHPPRPRARALASILLVAVLLISAAQLRPALAAQGAARADHLFKPGGFLTAPAKGDPLDIALAYIRGHTAQLGLVADDLADFVVSDRYVSAHNGLTHLYLRQRLDGVEVFNGDINVNVTRDGRILNVGNRFVGNLRQLATVRTAKLTPADAVKSAAAYLNLAITENLSTLSGPSGKSKKVKLSRGGISKDEIPVELMYQPTDAGEVRLVWDLVLRLKDNQRWLSMRVDATSGAVLSEVNWFSDSAPSDAHAAGARLDLAAAFRPAAVTNVTTVPNTGTYNVYALPSEDPSDGPRTLAVDPAVAPGSPYGWHDTDGRPGAEYTITRGNNAHAYADPENIDKSSGDEPDGGPGLVFDFPIDLTQQPEAYRDAAVTNLFYWNNIVHDIMYEYGFDEASGNFQANNYGRGGKGTDYVRAEAQDGGGFDNANFATPPDGVLPQMQMYLGLKGVVTVTAPAAIAGNYAAGIASFGALPTQEGVSGEVALADDGAGATSDGCERIRNDVAGKIALIDRGTCSFVIKVSNAQRAGASAVIIANNVGGDVPVSPGRVNGPGAGIKIVTLGISQNAGTLFKQALAQGAVSATLKQDISRDGSLDNGVIIHEYGHGISNRLTGGPTHTACLQNVEEAGEGWSDYFALVLTAKPGEVGAQARPIGTWLFNQAPDGSGIRPWPYSTDLSVNPSHFTSIQGVSVPHGVGTVFATMLWDMYWNLVDRYGFDPDLYDGDGGNNMALQLVIDGLKLQPCSPSFVESRDAILQADVLDYGGANQCAIWAAFAKRGLGVSASSGSSKKLGDEVESYALPASCA
jgi:hypothetical protein